MKRRTIGGWVHLRRKTINKQLWRTVNVLTVATMLANICGVGLLAGAKQASAAVNLIANGDLEQSSGSQPTGWASNADGSLTASFAYTGVTGNPGKAARITVSNYVNGDAKWYFNHVPTTGGHKYAIEFDYKTSSASTATNVTIEFYKSSLPPGSQYSYGQLALPTGNTNWTKFSSQFIVDQATDSVTVYDALVGNGTLTVDNFVMTDLGSALEFPAGMLTLDFDDTVLSHYTEARPRLNAANLKASFYAVTGSGGIGSSGYMTWQNIDTLKADGHEIGAHTRTHPDLKTITHDQAVTEIVGSKNDLIAHGITPTTFVYPYGSYNADIQNIVKDAGFTSARGVFDGYNFPSSDMFALLDKHVESTTTIADVQGWINEAMTNHKWLVIEFHEQMTAAQAALDPDVGIYYNEPAFLDEVIAAINTSGITTVTQTEGTVRAARIVAHAELDTALANYSQAAYTPENWTQLNSIKTNGDTSIDAATTVPMITAAKTTALNNMAGVQTIAQTLATAKSNAKAALNAALASYQSANYSAANWQALNTHKTTGDTNIDAATDLTGVGAAQNAALVAMSNVPTIGQTDAAAAANYTSSHAAVLGLTVNTVTVAHRPLVQAGLADFAALSTGAQALLTGEKALLDNLLAKIVILETPIPAVPPIPQVLGDSATHPIVKPLTLVKGVYSYKLNGKTIKIQPFAASYKGLIHARSVDFGTGGKIFIFMNGAYYKNGKIKVFDAKGKLITTYAPYGSSMVSGFTASIVSESNDRVYLAVGTRAGSTLAKVYRVTPKALYPLKSVTVDAKSGVVLVGFKKLYGSQYGLVTMKQGSKKTLKVWKLNLTTEKFAEDKRISKSSLSL